MKEALMADMFNRIAPRYDFLNRLLSFRQDVAWRKTLAQYLPRGEPIRVIDVATGTADLAISLCGHADHIKSVDGVDVAEHMLNIGREKVQSAGLSKKITLHHGTASALAFDNGAFDAATVAFGVRNFSHLEQSLSEMVRVLRKGGRLLVLEFSIPKNAFVRFFYMLYFRHLLPRVGSWLSRDRSAYRYLNESVEAFQTNDRFMLLMEQSGLKVVLEKPMTLGVVTLYVGEKC